MKTSSSGERIAGGIDQRYQAPDETASSIVNMRRDETGFGWINDRGWEPESVPNSNHNLANTSNLGIDKSRLYVWTRHRESEIYKVYKTSDGFLKYEHGNTFGMTTPTYPFVRSLNFTQRTSPKSDDPDEQYTPFGRFLTIVNGKDLPLKWWGRERVFPFGFTSPTPPPQILGPYPAYFSGTCDLGADPPTSTFPPPAGGKITFITDTGSESPLSAAATVQWQNNGGNRTYATFIERLPIGPPGTVARRIYRTKSLGDLRNDARDQQFYLVTQINDNCTLNYTDVMPDDLLTIAAPTRFASSVISTSYRFSANWDNRMWLAGGQGNETRIIYSDQGLPEQFPTFNYFDVGNRSGGAITQIFPYYDNLLVFRERAIDVVRPGGNGTLLCTRLSGDIGTTASNTVTNVEGLGVFFLAPDGVYVFSGGTIGGSSVRLERVSDTIMKEMRRISKSSLAQATAAYSHKEKEWWCFYPVDGQTHNSRSVVFHTQFNVNGLATLPDGRFIAAFKNKTIVNAPVINTNLYFPGGLCVWAGSMEGLPANRVNIDQEQQRFIGDPFLGAALDSEWSSAWESFGDDSIKKRVLSVEVEVLAAGNNTIQLDYAQDYREDYTSGGTNPTMVAELFDTANADAIYGGPNEDTFDKSVLTIGSTKWGERRSTRVRWDVNTGLLSWFQFRLRSSNTFQVVSYQIELVGGERRTINIRAGQRKTS